MRNSFFLVKNEERCSFYPNRDKKKQLGTFESKFAESWKLTETFTCHQCIFQADSISFNALQDVWESLELIPDVFHFEK